MKIEKEEERRTKVRRKNEDREKRKKGERKK